MVPLYLGLGACYGVLKDYDKAISVLREGRGVLPQFTVSFNDVIAIFYSEQGEYQKAIETYVSTLASFPDSSTSYFGLGMVYTQMGENEKAGQNMEKALAIAKQKNERQLMQEIEAALQALKNNFSK